jgi:deoxyhypusine synthase
MASSQIPSESSSHNHTSQSSAPTSVTAAVLKPSDPVPDSAQKVDGIDFNQYANRDITVAEMVSGMVNMGFQASAVGEAVRIINEMV